MSFCTVINCMDGRVQVPVIEYLQKHFNVKYVDSITEPGPNLILAEQKDINSLNSIAKRIDISVNKHGSVGIAIVGHYNCAGNLATDEEQDNHTREAVKYIKNKYPNIKVIGLWVDRLTIQVLN